MKRLFITLVLIITATIALSEETEIQSEISYLNAKSLGKYSEALTILNDWTENLSDPALIEINAFRVYEMMNFPELYDDGIDVLENFLSLSSVKSNSFVRSRIEIFLSKLYLEKGESKDAEEIIDSLGFFDFTVLGPFPNGSESEFIMPHLEENQLENNEYMGKAYRISWFEVNHDLQGVIDFDDFSNDIKNTCYYLQTSFSVDSSGQYFLCFGKSGYTEIFLDGEKIFSSNVKHGFYQDQYCAQLTLEKGTHTIEVKAGDSYGELIFSMRLADVAGNSIPYVKVENDEGESKSSVVTVGYFPSLNNLIAGKDVSDYSIYRLMYLYGYSGFCRVDSSKCDVMLQQIDTKSPYRQYAVYFASLFAGDITRREELLKEAAESNNLEAWVDLCGIKIKNSFMYDAYPMIEKIKEIDHTQVFYTMLLARFYDSKGWDFETDRLVDRLSKSEYPSLGMNTAALFYGRNNQYSESAKLFQELHEMSMFNMYYLKKYIESLEMSGEYETAAGVLTRSIRSHPNNIYMRLWLADLMSKIEGDRAALPYLTSAMKISPYNKTIMMSIADLYNRLGYKKLALFYYTRASLYDPDNYGLKQYIGTLKEDDEELDEFKSRIDVDELIQEAYPYRDEGAVVLLDETAVKVNAVGSFEKHIRQVILINKESSIEDFKSQYIVFSPGIESVENIKCMHISDGNQYEITSRYTTSLSDPDSRLYYDTMAYIVPISSLSEGSIVDLSYVIKNRGGDQYKNYFGDKVVLGSHYRILHSNTVVSFPDTKKIYYHLRNSKDTVKTIRKKNNTVYHYQTENCKPYKSEKFMPHYSEITPVIYFTSFKDWDELTEWYRSLLENRIKVTQEMKDALSKIISDSDSDLEKVGKIYGAITSNIRYVGFELGIGGIQPRFTDSTFNSRMGDCKDVSLLLTAMLREAGLDAYLALVRTRDKGFIDPQIPYLGDFNHAICYVDVAEGLFIDGTAEMRGYAEIPDTIRDLDVLVINDRTCDSGGSLCSEGYDFIKSNQKLYSNNVETVTTKIKLNESGGARFARSLVKEGDSAPAARYSLLSTEKKFISIEEYWNNMFPGAHVSNLDVQKSEINFPVEYSYSVDVPSFAQVTDQEIIFSPFISKSELYSSFAMLRNRKFPIISIGKFKTDITLEYTIPEGYSVYYLPESETVEHEKFSAYYSFTQSGSTITIKAVYSLKDYTITVDEYNDFREYTLVVDRKENERIILVKK